MRFHLKSPSKQYTVIDAPYVKHLHDCHTQKTKLEGRLSRLFDLRMDGEIDSETHSRKKTDYEAQLADTNLAIQQSQNINPNFYEDGCKILELSNRLYPIYLDSNTENKARILRQIASNYTFNRLTISATYVKPWDLFGNMGERITKRGWLYEFRNFLEYETPADSLSLNLASG